MGALRLGTLEGGHKVRFSKCRGSMGACWLIRVVRTRQAVRWVSGLWLNGGDAAMAAMVYLV
jgi:hypothetical protein